MGIVDKDFVRVFARTTFQLREFVVQPVGKSWIV